MKSFSHHRRIKPHFPGLAFKVSPNPAPMTAQAQFHTLPSDPFKEKLKTRMSVKFPDILSVHYYRGVPSGELPNLSLP